MRCFYTLEVKSTIKIYNSPQFWDDLNSLLKKEVSLSGKPMVFQCSTWTSRGLVTYILDLPLYLGCVLVANEGL